MWDQILKKKNKKSGTPDEASENGDAEKIEAPDVEDALDEVGDALAKADQLKAAAVLEEKRIARQKQLDAEATRERERERQRRSQGDSCGCGFR